MLELYQQRRVNLNTVDFADLKAKDKQYFVYFKCFSKDYPEASTKFLQAGYLVTKLQQHLYKAIKIS